MREAFAGDNSSPASTRRLCLLRPDDRYDADELELDGYGQSATCTPTSSHPRLIEGRGTAFSLPVRGAIAPTFAADALDGGRSMFR